MTNCLKNTNKNKIKIIINKKIMLNFAETKHLRLIISNLNS